MDLFEACDDSLVDAIPAMAEWQDGAHVVEADGGICVVGKSRFPTPYSNAVFPSDPEASAERLLDRAEFVFSDRRYIVWGRGHDGGDMGELVRERDFLPMGTLPAMAVEEPVEERNAPGVEVRRVTTESEFSDFVRVALAAYAEAGLPERVGQSLLARPMVAIQSSVIAVARIDGEPVAGAVSITNGVTGTGGVYWVGTTPAARRRGAADAVTRVVTNASFEHGASVVTLQASADGQPVYARMGYQVVGTYVRWLSPERE
jgi:ribosomal protein S18 acetylase RimI-like enzyme